MGWLELLPLLRRVLPLLDRLAPMLETAVAGRMGGRAAAEADSASVAELTKGSATMQAGLDEQTRLLSLLTSQTDDLRNEIKQENLRAAEQLSNLTAAVHGLRTLVLILLALVVLCLVMLLVLTLRHA